jgi:hypothetical protein
MSRRRGLAFLCCATDDAKLERLRGSIEALERPAGFDVELFVERGATSLTSAYNRLLRAAGAWRYKAYVHQDVVILNRRLVHDVLRLFRHPRIALIGAAGCRYLPESCVWWDGSGVLGRVVEYRDGTERLLELEQPEGEYQAVEAVDGLCLITQHDLPWDEGIEGFHFYDVAQATRFVLAGFDVVVPRQPEPWFAHEETARDEATWQAYYAARDVFRSRYGEARARFARERVRRRARRAAALVRGRVATRRRRGT